uniref:Transmembrane protein n=1 Tax=Craspedostauros australis TaxID=1486917 RepID=A0A7R9ZRR8_9STRA|mmetsp:Transcript_7524/g.20335  ORF Transcript_7524/g.20335 Transcript_7524/m.20335 type:complete len:517 (+) Transcript_7524:83-1633(+)
MMHPRRNPSHRVQHQPRSHTQSWPHRSFATNASTGGPSRRGITNFFLLRECRIFCTRYLRTSRRCFIVVLSITMLVCLRGASFFFVSNYSHMEFDLHSKSVLRDVSTLSASVTTRNHPQLFERFKQESKQAAKPPPAFTASNAPQDQMAAVVAMLRGELGNHLSGIAHARGLQLWMLEHHGISSKLVLHHPDHRNAKYKITREAVQQCFVNLRRFEHFDDGQYQDVDALDGRGGNGWWRWWTSGRNLGDYPFPESQTLVGMGRSDVAELDLVNGRPIPGKRAAGAREAPTKDDLSHALERFISLRQTPDPLLQPNHQLPVPLPYLQSESLDHFVFLDQYYTEMKELFKFDTESSTCCRQVPSPDETVFVSESLYSMDTLCLEMCYRDVGFWVILHKVRICAWQGLKDRTATPTNANTLLLSFALPFYGVRITALWKFRVRHLAAPVSKRETGTPVGVCPPSIHPLTHESIHPHCLSFRSLPLASSHALSGSLSPGFDAAAYFMLRSTFGISHQRCR